MIGVLACSKTKLAHPAPALELYTGDVFRLALAYLRAQGCERIVILSAWHGAVPGDQVLEPYDFSMKQRDRLGRAIWADLTRLRLRELVPAGARVLAIVPEAYAPALDLIEHDRLFIGLPIGLLKQALKRHLEAAA